MEQKADMRILLVSSSILPQTGGSSVIVESLAQNFTHDELTVLGSSTWKPDAVLGRKSDGPEFIYFFTELYIMGRGNRYFGWFRRLRLKKLYKVIETIIREKKITHVIGVYPNIEYCLAACRVADKLDVPFSSYFHNTYIENTAINHAKAREWQQEIFEKSVSVYVMSKGMQQFYAEKYKLNKFVPLVHTYNDEASAQGQTGLPGVGKTTYKLVAIGNFNESNLEATRRLLQAIAKHPKYELSVYTHVPKLLMEQRGLNPEHFHHKGAVSPQEIHEVIQQYDICILTHGFTGGYGEVEYKTIFPTRTIPLLLSGKPILAHSPEGSFLNDFIQEHRCAHLVDRAEEEAIIEGLEKISGDLDYQQRLAAQAAETARMFYGPQVVADLKNHLKSSA